MNQLPFLIRIPNLIHHTRLFVEKMTSELLKNNSKLKESSMDIKIEKIAAHLKKDDAKIAFFVGAGISTNCGIPDFRSPETGLYANLKRLDLPYPEAVFDIEYFRDSPKAFYTLADELYPGKFLPSRFHYFIKLCQDKSKLKRCYTQNIDTLERIAGVDGDYMVEAHGSFAANHCIDCDAEMETEELKKQMANGIPTCKDCEGYVKPDIVFFGEALPERFFTSWEEDQNDIDLAIVAGTSLAVFPFASLPAELGKKSNRVLINRELCGDFKEKPRSSDLILLEDCDAIVDQICEKLGWLEDLDILVKQGKDKIGLPEVNESAKELSKELAQEIAEIEKKEQKSSSELDDLASQLEDKVTIK